ncbi:Maf family protein [Opitutales bacterium]|nr:Maf family protein [Opitutales bacterium]
MNELEREGSDLKNFILGSGSPRRRELLAELLTDFRVVVSDAEEMVSHPDGPIQLVQENAILKARSVANLHPENWVLGADTLVALGETVLGKPKDMKEAYSMLRLLSGQTHEVSTGLCLIHRGQNYEKSLVESSRVTFKHINDEILEKYFQEVNPLDKAGGYAIQTRADLIVEKFEGSHSNVIGLPLELLGAWLKELNIC